MDELTRARMAYASAVRDRELAELAHRYAEGYSSDAQTRRAQQWAESRRRVEASALSRLQALSPVDRCAATTARGTQCSHSPREGSRYCGTHQQREEVGSA